MSPAPRGPLRIEAWIEAARDPLTTPEPLASSRLKAEIYRLHISSFWTQLTLLSIDSLLISVNLSKAWSRVNRPSNMQLTGLDNNTMFSH